MIECYLTCFSSVYKREKGSDTGEHGYLAWKC